VNSNDCFYAVVFFSACPAPSWYQSLRVLASPFQPAPPWRAVFLLHVPAMALDFRRSVCRSRRQMALVSLDLGHPRSVAICSGDPADTSQAIDRRARRCGWRFLFWSIRSAFCRSRPGLIPSFGRRRTWHSQSPAVVRSVRHAPLPPSPSGSCSKESPGVRDRSPGTPHPAPAIQHSIYARRRMRAVFQCWPSTQWSPLRHCHSQPGPDSVKCVSYDFFLVRADGQSDSVPSSTVVLSARPGFVPFTKPEGNLVRGSALSNGTVSCS